MAWLKIDEESGDETEAEERIAKVSVYIINYGLAGWKIRGIFLLLQFNLFELPVIYLKWQEWQELS